MLSGRAKVAAVIGWPVAHSRSPLIHGYWLERYAIDGAYVPFAVRPERFADAFRALPALGLAGANITLPHKEAALRLADDVDPLARQIGAANTAVVVGDRIKVMNTDAPGFLASLRAGAPGWTASAGPAVVIGAGGAARAVIVALANAGVREIALINRTDAKAQALAGEFAPACRAETWSERERAVAAARLIVNASSGGLGGRTTLEVPLAAASPQATVVDLVYDPLTTNFLRAAAARGCTTVDGLGMLLHQARPGFAAWFGVEPEVTAELRQRIVADIERSRRP